MEEEDEDEEDEEEDEEDEKYGEVTNGLICSFLAGGKGATVAPRHLMASSRKSLSIHL
jgi:hypothetical protein